MMAKDHGAAQLTCVMTNDNLRGLFGEHLRRQRRDALVRILDELQDIKQCDSPKERLSLERAVFQMFLSDNAAPDNRVELDVVSSELRSQVRKRIQKLDSGLDVFQPIEDAINHHLAMSVIPKFTSCDLYKTLGFNPEMKRCKAAR